jgi:hypothetical protein
VPSGSQARSVGPLKCLSSVPRHHELFAVVGELEDLLPRIVNDPHVALRVVRADLDAMRPAPAFGKEMIVLIPALDDLALRVGDDDAVAQLRLQLPGDLFGKGTDCAVEISG